MEGKYVKDLKHLDARKKSSFEVKAKENLVWIGKGMEKTKAAVK